jgi:hypothetical protein
MPMLWPESLPQQFHADGYQDAFADNRLATNPELGPALIRSRVSSMPRRVAGVMHMSKAQLNTLRYFWRTSTLEGKLPFNFPDPMFGTAWRKNHLPQSHTGGAVAGTPGTLPTGWSGVGTTYGITKSVYEVGVEAGRGYVDIRYSGIPTAPPVTPPAVPSTIAPAEILFHNPQITAASGQKWTASIHARLVGGTLDNIPYVRLVQYDHPVTVGVAVNFVDQLDSDALALQRYQQTITLPAAGVTGTWMRFQIYGTVAKSIDAIIRLAWPQLERHDKATAYMQTPNEYNPIARFAAGGSPPQPSHLGGDRYAVMMEIEIFEL